MSDKQDLGVLKARIDEAEPGLFKAVYIDEEREEAPNSLSVPDSHIGTDKEGVRTWVEDMARRLGYSSVVWE